MTQLLAVLPPYLPSSCPGSTNKTSRRNLFTKNKTNPDSAESNAKRMRTNSEGEFHSVPADGDSCAEKNAQTVGKGNALYFPVCDYLLCTIIISRIQYIIIWLDIF